MQRNARHFRLPGKVAIASLLTGLVLLLDAMAACPALHELIHHDADLPGHECAVTLFAHGQVDSASVEVDAVLSTALIETTSQFEFTAFSPLIGHLPAGRGPPVSCCLS